MIGKNILFAGVGFHEYDKLIINELSKTYVVYYINLCKYQKEHPLLYKLCCILSLPKLWDKLARRSIMQEFANIDITKIDTLLVIRGQYLDENIMSLVKQRFHISRSVLYLWDSWCNHANIDVISPLFDKVCSFDLEDCKNRNLIFRPLFYFDEQLVLSSSKTIDISFVGVEHSQRYHLLKKFKEISLRYKLTFNFKLLIGYVEYLKYTKFPFISRYNVDDADFLIGRSLSMNECNTILSQSVCVLDMPVNNQTGLTMRTIETLAAGVKLITANKNIAYYDDIPKDSYMILNENVTEDEIVSFIKQDSLNNRSLPGRYKASNAIKEILS